MTANIVRQIASVALVAACVISYAYSWHINAPYRKMTYREFVAQDIERQCREMVEQLPPEPKEGREEIQRRCDRLVADIKAGGR